MKAYGNETAYQQLLWSLLWTPGDGLKEIMLQMYTLEPPWGTMNFIIMNLISFVYSRS